MLQLGFFTKTLHTSPVSKNALNFFLLNPVRPGVILVGEDSLHVHEVTEGGHLRHFITKDDFDCKILSAAVLGTGQFDHAQLDIEIKQEDSQLRTSITSHSIIAITLQSAELVLLSIHGDDTSSATWVELRFPLPRTSDPLHVYGKLLVTDPKARAIALAAPEGGVLLLDLNPTQVSSNDELETRVRVRPEQKRPIVEITGHILHMVFLHPLQDDNEHVVLLLVKTIDRKVYLQHIEWLSSEGTSAAHVHNAQRINTGGLFPDLLVPLLTSASFVLACGPSLILFTDLLSGHVQQQTVPLIPTPITEGATGLPPALWTAYTQSPRIVSPSEEDATFVSTDQGDVYCLEIGKTDPGREPVARCVSSLDHRIGTTFLVYQDPASGSDMLLASEEMSSGGLYSIVRLEEAQWRLDKIEILENWSPTLDLVSSSLPRGHENIVRVSDSLFTTSGCGSAGTIAEMRSGMKARSGLSFVLDELLGCDKVYVIPSSTGGAMLMLCYPPMSGPVTSKMLSIDEDGVSVVDASATMDNDGSDLARGLDLVYPTVMLTTHERLSSIVQVTSRALIAIYDNERYVHDLELDAQESIMAADIDSMNMDRSYTALTIGSSNDMTVSKLQIVSWAHADPGDIIVTSAVDLSYVPVRLRALTVQIGTQAVQIVVMASSHGSLQMFLATADQDAKLAFNQTLQSQGGDDRPMCESLLVLDLAQEASSINGSTVGVFCGLRSGYVHYFELEFSLNVVSATADIESLTMDLLKMTKTRLGSTGVRLSHFGGGRNSVIATCESGLYLISCTGNRLGELDVKPIWLTDINEPSFQQGPITAIAQIPYTDVLAATGLALSLVTISGAECTISTLNDTNVSIVLRSLTVRGAPNRLIWSSQLSHFVVGSVETGRLDPLNKDVDVLTTFNRGLIDFRAPVEQLEERQQATQSCQFLLQAGERVFSILEWVYRSPENKKYVFILVGTGIEDDRGKSKGRIHILQPSLKRGRIEGVALANSTKLDKPVTAMSLYGDLGYISCAGNWLSYSQYVTAEKKWVQKCSHRLSSQAVHITTSPPLIHVTTAADSLMTFQLQEGSIGEDGIEQSSSLRPLCMDGRQATGLHHLTLTSEHVQLFPPDALKSSTDSQQINLMSTKTAQIRGLLTLPSESGNQNMRGPIARTSSCLFQAQLPRSLTRMAIQNTSSIQNEPSYRIVGTCVDGSMTVLAILDMLDWSKLQWIQTICQRSGVVCPYRRQHTLHHDLATIQPAPMGLAGFSRTEEESEIDYEARTGIPMAVRISSSDEMDIDLPNGQTELPIRYRPEDMHINGNILQRLLDRGGDELLTSMLRCESTREPRDRIAAFVAQNLETELGLVGPAMEMVRRLLWRWTQ